jgi:hypothetical protein
MFKRKKIEKIHFRGLKYAKRPKQVILWALVILWAPPVLWHPSFTGSFSHETSACTSTETGTGTVLLSRRPKTWFNMDWGKCAY